MWRQQAAYGESGVPADYTAITYMQPIDRLASRRVVHADRRFRRHGTRNDDSAGTQWRVARDTDPLVRLSLAEEERSRV